MKNNILSGRFLVVGGVLEILNGLIHFVMPFELVRIEVYSGLTDNALNFILLLTLAIGMCSTIFGLLSLYFAKLVKSGEVAGYFYAMSQVALWGLRLIGEFLFPVKVQLLSLENPTIIVIPIIVIVIIMFLLSIMYFAKKEHSVV